MLFNQLKRAIFELCQSNVAWVAMPLMWPAKTGPDITRISDETLISPGSCHETAKILGREDLRESEAGGTGSTEAIANYVAQFAQPRPNCRRTSLQTPSRRWKTPLSNSPRRAN